MVMSKWNISNDTQIPFELDYRKFEHLPQIHQLSTTFTYTTEEVFETLQKVDIDTISSHSTIEAIVNRNFVNTFQHQNVPNQRQHTHKKSQLYQHKNTSKQ